MTTTRKQYSSKFKARVAIEAIRGEKTLSPLGRSRSVEPSVVGVCVLSFRFQRGLTGDSGRRHPDLGWQE